MGLPLGLGETPVFRKPEARNEARFYTGDALSAIWRQAVEAAGMPFIALKNATRHSAGMQARNLHGWDLGTIATMPTHSSPKITRRFYAVDTAELMRQKMSARQVASVHVLPPGKK